MKNQYFLFVQKKFLSSDAQTRTSCRTIFSGKPILAFGCLLFCFFIGFGNSGQLKIGNKNTWLISAVWGQDVPQALENSEKEIKIEVGTEQVIQLDPSVLPIQNQKTDDEKQNEEGSNEETQNTDKKSSPEENFGEEPLFELFDVNEDCSNVYLRGLDSQKKMLTAASEVIISDKNSSEENVKTAGEEKELALETVSRLRMLKPVLPKAPNPSEKKPEPSQQTTQVSTQIINGVIIRMQVDKPTDSTAPAPNLPPAKIVYPDDLAVLGLHDGSRILGTEFTMSGKTVSFFPFRPKNEPENADSAQKNQESQIKEAQIQNIQNQNAENADVKNSDAKNTGTENANAKNADAEKIVVQETEQTSDNSNANKSETAAGKIEEEKKAEKISLPVDAVQFVRFGLKSKEEIFDLDQKNGAWAKILARPAHSDRLVIGKNGVLDFHEGVIESVNAKTVPFQIDGETLPVSRTKALGLIFYQIEKKSWEKPLCRLITETGESLALTSFFYDIRQSLSALDSNSDAVQDAGKLLTQNSFCLNWQTASGMKGETPINSISEIAFQTKKFVFLSELTPTSQRWTPFLSSGNFSSDNNSSGNSANTFGTDSSSGELSLNDLLQKAKESIFISPASENLNATGKSVANSSSDTNFSGPPDSSAQSGVRGALEKTPNIGSSASENSVASGNSELSKRTAELSDRTNIPVVLDGVRYRDGIRLSAGTTLTFALPESFETLSGVLGIDDETKLNQARCRLQVKIIGDKKILWEGVIDSQEKAIPLQISLDGVKELTFSTQHLETLESGARLCLGNIRLFPKE